VGGSRWSLESWHKSGWSCLW